jgi:anti-sigma28 factor (negative regulator of flagellin synthesis)
MAKTRHERDEDAREERLEHIRDQISSGDLVVRQMTA